jgi:hypothetical protein
MGRLENQSYLQKEAKVADQWEICELNMYVITICTPKNFEEVKIEEFLKRYNAEGQNKTVKQKMIICRLLSDGWEPYANAFDPNYSNSFPVSYFRRKYQAELCP